MRQLGLYSTLAMEMALSMAGGVVLGFYLDRWLSTSPWLTITFLLVGVAGGISRLAALMKIFSRQKNGNGG